jgi:ribosomal protein S12 methylthiotransferase accessory factor
LLEVVENHATAALDMFGVIPAVSRPLAFRCGEHPLLDKAVAAIGNGNGEVTFVEVKANVDLPVVGCFIQEEVEKDGFRTHAGFACRTGAMDAALAALLEAAQSRLTDISGARDDIVPADYRPKRRRHFNRAATLGSIGSLDPADSPGPFAGTAAKLRHVLRRICSVKEADAYVFPLAGGECGAYVVRVLATQFEAATDDGVVKLGSDILARFLEPHGAYA